MPTVTTRPASPADTAFLFEVFAASGAVPAALAAVDPRMVDLQFKAGQTGYAAAFPDATHEIILVDGEPAGQVRWAELADEIRIVDVAVLPRFRRQSAATSVYRRILARARARGTPVRATVARLNGGSLAFHQRLGFTVSEEAEIYVVLTSGVG